LQKRILPTAIPAFILITLIAFSCTKMDTTTLAADLVAVDNVNTFADTVTVTAAQGFFNNDSTLIGKNDNHVVGNIINDPVFGTTQASVFVQLKPIFYPFVFGNTGDVITALDSVVLCLSYKGAYGDTSASSIPQTFTAYEVSDANFRDSVNKIRDIRASSSPAIIGTSIGSAVVTPQIAAQKVVFSTLKIKDSVDHQIRIKLSTVFANRLFHYDSTSVGPNNAFKNDSLFRSKVNGIAVKSTGGGNCLFYVNLAEAKTRIEFFYRKTNNSVPDTVYQTFQMYSTYTTTGSISSTANTVVRNYGSSPAANYATDPTHLFLQTSPGTYATLKFPDLMTRPNRIIHRAYLVVEDDPFDPDVTDKIYTAPPYMYVDLRDSTTAVQYKPIYFDLNISSPYAPDQTVYYYPYSNVDPTGFGGTILTRYSSNGKPFTRYEINITRYIQQLLTKRSYNYDLRLYAPYSIRYPQYPATPISGLGSPVEIPYYNALAGGRVRIGSPLNATHPMRLVIIYSNI
jgi:hypothetical protein